MKALSSKLRKRPLWLGLLTAVALGALGAGVALALVQGHMKAESYTAHGTAEAATAANYLTVNGVNVQCRTGSGTTEISAETPTVTVTPSYSNCISGERFATVATNGCTYVFHIGEGEGDSWGLTADLSCPAEKKVEASIYNNPEHTELWCTITVSGQTGLIGLAATNVTENGAVVGEGTIESLSATEKGTCTSGEDKKISSAIFHVSANLAAVTGAGVFDGLQIG